MFKTVIMSKSKLLSEKNESQNSAAEIIELTREMRDEQTEAMTKRITKELIKLKENSRKAEGAF